MADDNGAAPAPPPAEESTSPPTSVAERLMGLFGLAVAIGVALISLDLIFNGGLSRIIPVREPGDG